MKAHALKRVDRELEIHSLAWLINQAQATKEQGKKIVPVHKEFKQFFDYDKRIESILKPKAKEKKGLSRLEKLMLQANS